MQKLSILSNIPIKVMAYIHIYYIICPTLFCLVHYGKSNLIKKISSISCAVWFCDSVDGISGSLLQSESKTSDFLPLAHYGEVSDITSSCIIDIPYPYMRGPLWQQFCVSGRESLFALSRFNHATVTSFSVNYGHN